MLSIARVTTYPEFEHEPVRTVELMLLSGSSEDEVIFQETTRRFWVLCLVTEVRADGVYVRLSPFERTFRRVAANQIQEVHTTSYAATAYGGWHWGVRRTLNGNTVYRLRGSQGIEIVRKNGKRWFLGSQHPAELESAVERIRSPA